MIVFCRTNSHCIEVIQSVIQFLNRPVAEDFSLKNQAWQSLQAGLYVCLFFYFFMGSFLAEPTTNSPLVLVGLLGVECALASLVANGLVPRLLPAIYDEDQWTVWKQILQTLFVLFCISLGTQLLLMLTHNPYPSFGQMYTKVTLIGFFPIISSVFVVEHRRLKRNLARTQVINQQLLHRPTLSLIAPNGSDSSVALVWPNNSSAPEPTLLLSETGKERLRLQADQLLYLESVGNYVALHWTTPDGLQKTLLRSTLKEQMDLLAPHPQFLRCHRAFIVNLRAIHQTQGNARGYQLSLRGIGEKIPVSRNYLPAFGERMAALG